MYVHVTYRNPMFSTYVLHKRHGQFFGAHSQIFFLNSVGDTILFNSVGKMSHISGFKLVVVSQSEMTVLILLPCSVVLFLRLKLLSFWRNISVKTLGVMFLFTLNISYARVYKLRCCIVTDLSFSESSEKLDEKSLYTKLCALLCNPLMWLINVLLWFIQTKVQSPN